MGKTVNKKQQEAMLEALEKSLGIVTTAAKSIGITRQTHYNWMSNNPEYKKAVEDLENVALDFAESKLHENIMNNDTASTIFYLKTKGKKRGFGDQVAVDHSIGKMPENVSIGLTVHKKK